MKSLTLEQIDKILEKTLVELPKNFLKLQINKTESICLKDSGISIQKAKCSADDSFAYCFYLRLRKQFEKELSK